MTFGRLSTFVLTYYQEIDLPIVWELGKYTLYSHYISHTIYQMSSTLFPLSMPAMVQCLLNCVAYCRRVKYAILNYILDRNCYNYYYRIAGIFRFVPGNSAPILFRVFHFRSIYAKNKEKEFVILRNIPAIRGEKMTIFLIQY